MAKKNKKIPVFVFVMRKVLGKTLLEHTDQTHDMYGKKILKTKKYDCERDCNGIRINIHRTV